MNRPPLPHRLVRALALSLAMFVCGGPWAARSAAAPPSSNVWETLTDCWLLPGRSRDGDSFHVLHLGREFVFRLYSVDCPETDNSFPDRVREQANDFRISTDQVLQLGAEANRFTEEFLRRPFTVITRRAPAMGRTKIPRVYALVRVGTLDLAEELIGHGLARLHGIHPDWPDAKGRERIRAALVRASREALDHRAGYQDRKRYPQIGGVRGPDGANPPSPDRVNLNSASALQLEALPGIGPKLAQRIIAARPLRSLDDLGRIPGVGPKTFSGLTNRVTFGPARPAGR